MKGIFHFRFPFEGVVVMEKGAWRRCVENWTHYCARAGRFGSAGVFTLLCDFASFNLFFRLSDFEVKYNSLGGRQASWANLKLTNESHNEPHDVIISVAFILDSFNAKIIAK